MLERLPYNRLWLFCQRQAKDERQQPRYERHAVEQEGIPKANEPRCQVFCCDERTGRKSLVIVDFVKQITAETLNGITIS